MSNFNCIYTSITLHISQYTSITLHISQYTSITLYISQYTSITLHISQYTSTTLHISIYTLITHNMKSKTQSYGTKRSSVRRPSNVCLDFPELLNSTNFNEFWRSFHMRGPKKRKAYFPNWVEIDGISMISHP